MITLYTFGPYFGLPDGSPFVTKVMLLLKLAGLAYGEDSDGYARAPKGKLPYINDHGTVVADSTFIRRHIETKYGFDFDAGLTGAQRAVGWAVERMCEDHLYWAIIDARWLVEANFVKGPRHFFDPLPRPIRPLVARLIQHAMRKRLKAHGLGAHARADIETLGIDDIEALARILGDKPFVMGNAPTGADATVFAFVAGALAPTFDTPIRSACESHPNLVAYRDRVMAAYFSPRAG
jgi:glutathione S-transferase